jgi:predicted DNA-binding protein
MKANKKYLQKSCGNLRQARKRAEEKQMSEKKGKGSAVPVWLHKETLERADKIADRCGEARATVLRLVIKLGLDRLEQVQSDEELARELLALTKPKGQDRH